MTFFGAAVAYLDQSAPPSETSSSDVSKLATQPLFEGPVARLVASTPGKLGVATVFLALFLGGALSFNSVKREAGFEPIFDTEDSTIIRWQYAAYRHYGDAYTWNVTLVLASPDIEYSDAAARARIGEAVAAAGASEFVDGGSVDSWLDTYVAEVAPTAAAFYPSLRGWLASPSGRRFANDVELSDDEGCTSKCVVTSRIDFTQSAARWGDAFPVYVSAVETMAPFADLDARLFSDEYIVYELDEYNKVAGMYAVAVGTVGILVALFLFFPPGTAVVTALSIFAIEVMTVPFVVLGGIRIGPAVVFSAGAAFGLASDNIVHVLHAWTEAKAAGAADPVAAALSLVGHPILFSGCRRRGCSRRSCRSSSRRSRRSGWRTRSPSSSSPSSPSSSSTGYCWSPPRCRSSAARRRREAVMAEALGPNGPWAKKGALV